MKKAVLLMAAAALLLSVQTAGAAPSYDDNVPYCENWQGTWEVTYSGGRSDNITSDNITIDKICKKNESCLIGGAAKTKDFFWCQATGKRASDNATIMFAQVFADPNSYGYYENPPDNFTQTQPYDSIPKANITCDSFDGIVAGINNVIDYKLISGTKISEEDNCTIDTDNQTEDNCTLGRVIPSRIGKLYALIQPVSFFILVADEDTEFVRGDKAEFDSDAIRPLVSLRLGKRLILVFVLFRPLQLEPGEITVSVGDCSETITVRGQE